MKPAVWKKKSPISFLKICNCDLIAMRILRDFCYTVDLSNVKAVTDRQRLAVYHSKHC